MLRRWWNVVMRDGRDQDGDTWTDVERKDCRKVYEGVGGRVWNWLDKQEVDKKTQG